MKQTGRTPQGERGDAGGDVSAEMGARIRAARARAGVTRKQLAASSGASERYLAHLEAGTGNPSVDMVWGIARALDLAPAELLPLGGERGESEAEVAALVRRLSGERRADLLHWLQHSAVDGGQKDCRIALVGLRGAGKSSLGKQLAKRLGMPFFEMSKEVERLYGGAIGVLIELNGQAALRRYEAEILATIVRQHKSAVIAAPGAIVAEGPLYETLLKACHSIWLQASPEDHMDRVVRQGDLRPMAGGRNAMEDLRVILASRSDDYARADARLDTSRQGFDETLDQLEGIARALIA